MKLLILIAALSLSNLGFAQSARSYYDELYKVGGLDRMADEYVCFDDEPTLQTFFIFSRSDTLKQFLESEGGYAKLSAKEKAGLTKGFLIIRGYDKGVPLSGEDTYTKDGESWISDLVYMNKQSPIRIRFDLSWQTLRYKRAVELLKSDKTLKSQVARYGRCEIISSTVRQKAD